MNEQRDAEKKAPMVATAPPLAFAEEPPLEGGIGPEPEDFVVREVPLYPFSGEGEHLMLHIEKRMRTTREVVKILADWAQTSPREVGYAGMKDKHAVTSQWFSLPVPASADFDELAEGCRLLEATRHSTRLRTGHLSGNRFEMRLHGVNDIPALIERVEALKERCIPNGFDAQRFGRGGRNLEKALRWAEGGIKRVKPFERKLFASVLQAEVFNRLLVARFALEQPTAPQLGDVVRLAGSRSVFVVEDIEEAERRLKEGDIVLTGPIFGPKARSASGTPGELEAQAVASLGLSERAEANMAKAGSGTRRDICLHIANLAHHEEGGVVTLAFTLPAGSYATLVVRNVLNQPWKLDLFAEDNA